MLQPKSLRFVKCCTILSVCLAGSFFCVSLSAQTDENIAELKQKALELTRETKYVEALPLLEKIVIGEPDNAQMHFYLGFALIAKANNSKDVAERKGLRLRARAAFIKSKQLKVNEPLVDALIQAIPLDGSDGAAFSQNIAANSLMMKAEALFSQGKLDEALSNYEKALEVDPKLYHAALFAGDVYMQKGDLVQSQVWYERAIAIDPNRETAYRYSATPLMKQGNIVAARDRYVEAFITEPYNKFARAGLVQWAQLTQTELAHPAIEIPSSITFDDKGNANVTLDTNAMLGGKEDGSFAWISYGLTRSTWRKERFGRKFPGEPAYRHSLAEEVDALRSVITLATSDKQVKTLSPSLTKLKRLDEEGLLEAYILLAHPDEGIAKDHPAYLKEHRDKLRRYMIEYVVTGAGNWQKF